MEERLVVRLYPEKKGELIDSIFKEPILFEPWFENSANDAKAFGNNPNNSFEDFIKNLNEIALSRKWDQYHSRLISALQEAAICYYTNLSPGKALEHFDFYLERVDAITLSENLNQLAESTPYHQALYSTISEYIRDHKFGQLIPKQEKSLENDLLKFALQREQRKKFNVPSLRKY